MPQPDTLYFDDGNGRIRQVPSDKLEIFKQYFPNSKPADERALRQIEEERALRSEKEGKTKIPEIKLRQPDLTGLHGSVSLQENASIPEVAKDVLNIHRYDPEISFSAKYGAYKDNPELFRDRWEDTENVPLTELAQKKYDQIKAKSRPKGMTPIVPVGYAGMPAKPQQEKPDELESLKDFLTNTPSGRGFVEYDKKRKESFAQLDKQLNAEIANLEKEINEKSSARQKLIERGVPGTTYGVKPSWLSREERAKIDSAKAKDVEEADKIATQDDLDLAMKNLNELKMLQAAVKDKDRNAVSQFFREFGRRLPESLVNIGTLGIGDVIEGLSPRTGGPIASRSEDILSQYASLHQNDRTIAQDIAQGTTGSLEFMAQFAGAGGIAKGAAGAIGKGLLREGARQAAKQTATKGAEKVLKIAGKEVSESLLQTAIMPSTLASAIEKNAENPGSFLDSYANAFASNLVEVGSERVGQFIPGLEFKNLPPSIQKIRKATGIQGAGVEFLEEQFATAGHAMLGDEQAEWKDLVDPRKQLITAGVVGVIQLPYAAINAGGYAAAKHNDKKQKISINQAYTNNLTNIQTVFGNEAKDVISWVNGIIDNNSQDAETISKIISGIATSNEFDEKQSDALIKYSLAYLAKNGLERGKSEEIQQVQKEAQETIQQTINPETNSIILAKIPGVEEPTFIQGNIILHEDGSIDTHQSGEIYYTDGNGKRQVIDPKFVEIIENVPYDMAIEEATAAKTAEVVNRQANDEVRQYEPGEIVRFTSGGNTSLIGKIANVDESGNYQVMVDGVPAPVNVEPRMIIEEDNLRGVDNGVQVDYTDEKGNIVTGTVDDMSLRNNGIIVIDEKEVPSVNVIGVHREEQAKQEEVDRMSEITPENEGIPDEQIEQNVTETAKEETKGQTVSPVETEQPSGQDADAEKQAFMQSLPIVREGKNKGQIDQSRMTPEQNIKYFEYQYGPDKALRAATKMVDNLKERIKKEQAKLDADPFNIAQNDLVENLLSQQKVYQDYVGNATPAKEEVKVTESTPDDKANIEPAEESITTKAPADVPEQATRPNKKRTTTVSRQDEQQEQAKIEENMTDVDRFLSDIEKQKEAIRQEVEKMTPKQREEWWGEPQSLREYIMRELINGQRILWSDTPTSKGFGSHLGMKGKESERRKYIGLLGSAKTNALTPEAFAHMVWEDVVSKGGGNEIGVRFHNVDTMGVLDEVLDVLYTHYSKGQMISDINESRLEQVFNELDMQAGVAMSGAWDIDPNEESQNEILRGLMSEAEVDEVSMYEIEEYYVNQVTQDEFYEYFYKFVVNNNDYDETGAVGNSQQDAGEGSVIANGEGRDQDSPGDNEGAEEADRADEREAETSEESAGSIGYGQNDQGGRGQNAERVAGVTQEIPSKSLEQRIKEAETELKKKQEAYSRLYGNFLSLKKKAEKDPSYGMSGQVDIFGNVSGSDNLFAGNEREINSGIRQVVLKAELQAEEAARELKDAQKNFDRLRDEQFNRRIVLTIKQDDDIINNYESLNDLGLLADEQAGYEPRKSENIPGTTDNGLMFHVVDEAGYYSTVEDALEKIKQEKGTPEQFKAMLLKNGAKQAELDWMGWDETFTGKSVTKVEIQDWINQNKIEISEVRKEKPEPLTKEELEFKKQDIEILADLETREKFDINEPINLFDGYYYQGRADEDVLNEIASKNGYSYYEDLLDAMSTYYNDIVDEELSKLEEEREDNTKYSYYVLPGGRNYKELLLTMPHKISEKRRRYEELRAKEKMTESERREFSDLVNDDVDISDEKFRSLHFDEPNILTHIRFDERMANGDRILFLEEIQSDWAQKGKRHGFKTGKDKDVLRAEKALEESNKNLEKAINRRHELGLPVGAGSTEQKMFGSEIWLLGNNKEYIQLNRELEKVRNNKDYNSIQQRMEEIKKEYDKANSDYQKALDDVELDSKVLEKMKELSIISERYMVPDMPFKKTDQWVTLAFRRMMRYAAENGYDRIAWTTGEQQADRYNLSKQVDRIVIDEENGQYSIMAVPKGEQELENIATATKENLSDYVGKEIALKAINEGGGDFRGDDLKVGGEGMRAFYDQIVPSVVKKIGKPFGVDIETIELPEIGTQQSIPITDDMRGYAENGMPLFSIAQMSEDIDTRLNAAKTPQEKTKIVSDMVDELESRYKKSVDTVVLPTKKDVFESLRMMGADSELLSMAEKTKAKLNGVYFNGTIYLNSSSLDKAKNVAEVWAHENFHAWISDKKELLVPLINNLEDDFLNANLHAYYHKLDKEEKVNELLAFAVGRIFTGRDIARIKEADIILPVIIKYLDYVTEGEFSKSGARIRSGRRSDADALRDNQGGVPQSERINQPGEVSYQPQQEDGTVLPGYGGISGAGGIAESAYAPMPQQKEEQSVEDYSREVSDWYFKQRELSTPPLFSVSDAADRAGSKMPEDLRKEYDIKYDRFFTRFREAWEDTFLPVKDFLDLLRKNGVEIAEYNDFYKQATHLQGKNDAQLKIFKDNYQHPITLAVSALVRKGFRYRDIENYVFAKHGLERNEYMRNAAIEEWENNHPEAEENERAAFIKSLPNDYAGITALEEELGQPAEMFIDSFESKAGEEDINRLWAAINNATHWTLTKQYQTGMINKEVYDDLMNRYQYYVPLRGHDKETAEDRWDYTPDMGTFFTAPLVRAKGRRSRAESPFAFIEQMAHSAIVQGNKNTLKQSILRLAQKENGGLMSATKTWKVNVGTKEKPIWEQQSAPYSEDLDTYLQNQQLFEERMQQLKKEGMAYQGRAKLDIGDLFIKPKQAEQHEIRVYQNGISYTVYINANPAIAKAINGANRKDISNNLGLFSTITRNMAANFTTRNPLFVMTNFSRDYIYSTTMLLAKETPEFMFDFQRNLPAAANALRRYERGNVDLNKKSDQYLYEYMINGGKTGFSHIFELDRVSKSLEREAQKGGKKNFADHARAIIDVIDMFNEVAENTTRLSVYITSREHGKSIIDSINDAKNITVNFNQKGAGSSVGKNSFEQVILSAAGWVRPLYLFSNAAIQALSNIVKVTNKHPVKMAAILSSYALIGFISPLLAAMIGGDDGKDSYMKLSDWERQNNWCVLLPNGSFLKIPLPQELRIFSRMGDNIYQAYTGKKDILQVLMDIAFSISDLLPMNPLGAAGTSWAELSPDFARPIVQIVGTNTNFMGSRIYNEWANKNMPGYLKARTNKKGEYYAPNFMVDWFMILDHLTGGDGVKKGVISLNPDITNHLLRGYFGGLYTIAEQGIGIASEVYNFTKTGELDIKVRETPLRAFYADKNDLQLQSSGISSRYYDIYDKVIESRRRAKAYTEKVQQGEMGIDEYSRVMSELNMPKINAIYDRIKEIKRIEREMKEMNPQQQKQAEEMIFDLRKEVVELNGNQ